VIPFVWNVFRSWRYGEPVTVDDPWGHGNSLEWATSCPPPRHNFVSIPRIRSESPAFDLHHPEIAAIELEQNESARDGDVADAPDMDGRAEHLGRSAEGRGGHGGSGTGGADSHHDTDGDAR
jgi:cytochrome c oxidase subunit 1